MNLLTRLAVVALFTITGCQKATPPPQQQSQVPKGPAPGSLEWKIQNAMSGGPEAIASAATIMDWPASPGAQMTQLRAGTNGWTCLPDLPSTSANDPMCVDATFLQWLVAYAGHKPETIKQAGFSYMLQGGEGSNIDPSAEKPDSTNQWIKEGPHLMMVVPSAATLGTLGADPKSGGPWVMWKGTPYAHVMMPMGR